MTSALSVAVSRNGSSLGDETVDVIAIDFDPFRSSMILTARVERDESPRRDERSGDILAGDWIHEGFAHHLETGERAWPEAKMLLEQVDRAVAAMTGGDAFADQHRIGVPFYDLCAEAAAAEEVWYAVERTLTVTQDFEFAVVDVVAPHIWRSIKNPL